MHALALSKAASPAAKNPDAEPCNQIFYIPPVSFYVMYHLCTLYYVLKIVFKKSKE